MFISLLNSCYNEVGNEIVTINYKEVGNEIVTINYSLCEISFHYVFISGRPDKDKYRFLLKCGPVQVHNKKSHKVRFSLLF